MSGCRNKHTSYLADDLSPHAAFGSITQRQLNLAEILEVGATLHHQDVTLVSFSPEGRLGHVEAVPVVHSLRDEVQVIMAAKKYVRAVFTFSGLLLLPSWAKRKYILCQGDVLRGPDETSEYVI